MKKTKKNKFWKRQNYKRRKCMRVLKKRKRRNRLKKGNNDRGYLSPLRPDIYEKFEAPLNFSLIDNTEQILKYFKENSKLLSKRKQVEFDLSDINNLTTDALALLCAKVNDTKFTRGLSVKGSSPSRKDLKRVFDESGFLDHVQAGLKINKNHNNFLIHKITDKKVENEIAKKIGEIAVNHSFDKKIKFKPVYEILIECMANTNNHAGLNEQGKYNWWVLVYCDPKTKITHFSFLDLGIGIFNSLPMQGAKRRLISIIKNKTQYLIDLDPDFNATLLPDLFKGGINFTRTGKSYRGKGLPLIMEHSKNKSIENFTIISNNIYVEIPSLSHKVLKNKLNGTLLYWELHPNKI